MDPAPEEIRASVQERFGRLARCPAGEKGFAVGAESARTLGYPAASIEALPRGVAESFAGVGYPFALGAPQTGQTVLDRGCGAGFDSILAARMVGPSGRVIGVDITPEMVAKARDNASLAAAPNAEFRPGDLESLPVTDQSVDVAFSNGVFNLCPDKPKALREVFRVLRRGGRLVMADILLEDHVTPDKVQLMGSWSG
jgi:arsenite methyltransferase